MKDISDLIKERIRKIMESQGLKKHTLAEKAGIAAPTIQNWYTSRNYQPTIYSLSRICEALNISMSQLFLEEGATMYPITEELNFLIESYLKIDIEGRQLFLDLLKKLRKD